MKDILKGIYLKERSNAMFIISMLAYAVYMFSPSWASGKLGGFGLLLPLLNMILSRYSVAKVFILIIAMVAAYFLGNWMVILTGCESNKKFGLGICAALNIVSVVFLLG